MSSEDVEATVAVLARAAGLDLDAQLLKETSSAWLLMRPHLQTVLAAELTSLAEPASLFRP